ncbi:sodium:proton antiporter [Clostridia bacterium]|nr:sodium:proton antiporter [Clostridia bacterium]GHU75028.1 sodium:proton antiporter [Clostridia bacterium]
MEVVNVVIAILFAIVLSNVLNNLFPKLPLTLIQIGFGCLLAMTSLETTLELEPELFMVMIITPLLYHEAEVTDLSSLWQVKRPIFLMAFLLVFITVFAIGFSVHMLIPAIPIAACFALGAILGPTDVVAVSSLSSQINIDGKLMTVLLGEGLINDASGVTAFSFAKEALLTGGFSPFSAFTELVFVSVGGLIVGYLLISIKRSVIGSLETLAIHSTATYVLIELLMPFLCYIAAELCGVSGILAAVMAGSRQGLDLKKTGLFEADLVSSTHTLWEVITFTLNSIVFLLLGLQLPSVVSHIWNSTEYTHTFLIITSLIVTSLLFVVRFLSVFFIARDVLGDSLRVKLKSAVILTLSGVKGAVSLATAFSLPFVYSSGMDFAERPMLLFITSAVIIISLLVALVTLPLIADTTVEVDVITPLRLELLEETLEQLNAQERMEKTGQVGVVIAHYQRRIRELKYSMYAKIKKKELDELHSFAYSIELSALKLRRRSWTISTQTYLDYVDLISTVYHKNLRGMLAHIISRLERLRWVIKRFIQPKGKVHRQAWIEQHRTKLKNLFSGNVDVVVRALNGERQHFSEELIELVIDERTDLNRQVMEGLKGALHKRQSQNRDNVMLKGYYVERRVIHQFLEQSKITAAQANLFRVDVNKLESFTLAHSRSEVVLKFLELTGLQ